MNLEEADIAVIGLGPAGASAARAAALGGARVIAFDRKRQAGRPVQCAEFTPMLLGTEVDELSAASVQEIARMVTFVEDEGPDVTANFPGRMIDRGVFDAALAENAARAGADCRFGVKIVAIDEEGAILFADGGKVRVQTIIGADGPRSIAGRAIGSANTEIVETRQFTAPLAGRHQATDIFLSNDMPGGYGWLFPKGDVANVGLGVSRAFRDRLKPALESLRARLIREGRIGAEIIAYTGGAIPVGGLVRAHGRLGRTQLYLAGDAAGLANPITGAGIAAAVMSGKLAAEAALAGGAQAGADYQEELEDLFGPALQRARRHRERLWRCAGRSLTASELRSGWIAYPDYWAA